VTFVLTDIEGSTRMFRRLGPAYRPLLETHNALLRAQWERFGGVEVKTVGDSFVVAFASAADALAAAVGAQRAITNHAWPEGAAMRVRIGVHTGMAYPHEHDYIALALHQASRVVGAANGGFVLASEEAVDAAGADVPVRIEQIGAFRLRDFDRPVVLSAVGSTGLEMSRSVPVRAVPAQGHNLIAPSTSFVGRDEAIEDVTKRLGPGRLSTIVGPGGMGKTRLAVELGLRIADDWPDGVWLADLSKATNGRLVAAAVADAIGVSGGERDDRSVVLEHLGPRTAVLILDSCEHVPLAAARLATDILASCPDIALLATSRQPLALAGEGLWRIGPLSTAGEAVQLFLDRARSHAPDFTATDADRKVISEICAHVDRMPLAIELASARLSVLTPPEILEGLRQRFQLLRGRDPSAPARQRTMQGLLDWDYELLSEHEQAALARLSIFAGSFNLRAASAAAGHSGVDADDVADLVWSLSDKSLVNVERSAGATRYRLLETVRAYAAEKLVDSGDGTTSRRVLADHYLDGFPPRMRGRREWIDGVALELDTMVGLIPGLARESPDQAYGLAWIANDHRSTTGHFELARAEAAALLDGPVVHGPALARLLAHTAGLNASAGNVELAESRLALAEEILANAGTEDRWGKVTVTGGKTTVALYRRDRESLLDAVRRIEADLEDPADPTARTDALWWLSMLRSALGEGDEIALATEAVELSRQSGDHVALVGALCAAAEYALRANDDVRAATHQREAMRLAAELRIHVYTAFSFIIAARLANERAQPDAAVLLHAAADVILARISFTLMPDDQELSDEMFATAREALGANHYTALEAEGRALPVDRAVDMVDQIFRQVV
jgi:predicted ATPase/class 3 adenylate cyclase